MKIQSCLATALLVFAAVGVADERAAAPSPQALVVQRAEALTEEQISQSNDLDGLSKLGQIYAAQNDLTRLIYVLRRTSELLPDSGDLKLQLAMAYARVGDKRHAYDTLLRMQMQGFGYQIAKDPRFEPIRDTKVWDYIVTNLEANAKPFGEGKLAFTLPAGDHRYDTLAWDDKRGRFLVGSKREGGVYLADESGKLTPFIAADARNGPWQIDAVAVDGARRRLFVASSSTPLFNGFDADNAGKSALFEYELDSGKLRHVYPLTDAKQQLSYLVVDPQGTVYAADGAQRTVYKLENAALVPILSNPKLTGIRAMALSGDGRTLYLADFALGIFGVDLTKRAAFELARDAQHLVLGGIVDLHWYQGHLVIVEDGMVPKRVMRLKLSADGRAIDNAMPLDVAKPEFVALGRGTVAGDHLYFVTNRQDELYDSQGVLTDRSKLQAARVFRSNLRFAWGKSGVGIGTIPIGSSQPGAHQPGAAPGG
jgi:hypothetical protein